MSKGYGCISLGLLIVDS